VPIISVKWILFIRLAWRFCANRLLKWKFLELLCIREFWMNHGQKVSSRVRRARASVENLGIYVRLIQTFLDQKTSIINAILYPFPLAAGPNHGGRIVASGQREAGLSQITSCARIWSTDTKHRHWRSRHFTSTSYIPDRPSHSFQAERYATIRDSFIKFCR